MQLILCLVLIFMTSMVHAENPHKSVTLDTVVVSADALEDETVFQTGDVDQTQATGFYVKIERDRFEGKMLDLSEVIEKEAGIQVRRSGGAGSFATVSLRGSSNNQVMVYMDGILLNDASGGGVDLSNISLADVASIEIYQGITPANFGKPSIGGVVNIKTLRTEKGLKSSIEAGYGSFNTIKTAGFINHKPGQWDYLLSANYFGSDNDFKILNDNSTPLNPNDDQHEKRNNAQFNQQNLLTKFGYDFSNEIRMDLANQFFYKDQHLPSWNNSKKTRTFLKTQRNNLNLKLICNNLSPYFLNLSYGLNYGIKKEEYDDTHSYIGLGKQHTKYNTDSIGGNFLLEWLTEKNALSLVMEAKQEKYEHRDLLKKQNPHTCTRLFFSIGAQDSLTLLDEQLAFTTAVRFINIDDDLKRAVSIWSLPLESSTKNTHYISPQVGLKYRLTPWLTLKTNVAQYTREPSFFELFGDRGFFIGNHALKSEKGINFDFGFKIKQKKTGLSWVENFACKLVYFRNDVDDLITRTYDSIGIGKSVNISGSCIEGIEAELDFNFLEYFRLIANATWQDPENQTKHYSKENKLPGRFEYSLGGRLEAKWKGCKIYYEHTTEKEMYYDTANLLKAEDKDVSSIGATWLINPVLINFEVRNLGDQYYEDFNGYPSPGISWFLSIKYNF